MRGQRGALRAVGRTTGRGSAPGRALPQVIQAKKTRADLRSRLKPTYRTCVFAICGVMEMARDNAPSRTVGL